MITPKITLNQFLISVLPGGFVVSIILITVIYSNPYFAKTIQGIDFLMTFMFVCLSFIFGEVLQTIARGCEKTIDWLFFRGYRPSDIFLLRNNPVLKDEKIKEEVIKKLKLTKEEKEELIEYSEAPFAFWKKKSKFVGLNKKNFWKIYSKSREAENIKESNARYLFTRVMFVIFVFLILWFSILESWIFVKVSSIFMVLFLWRARGCARGLVFSSVNKYLSE